MKAQKGIRVLIVEDESLVAEVVQALLERSGYVVVGRAAEGVQAVEMTQSLRPDVVLMDIALPGMDGLEATRRIYKACPTPVVVLSAYDMPELVELASAVGVGAYLVKPPRARELERAITISMARFGDLVTLRRLNAELYAEVAERKRAEEAMRESEQELATLFELLPVGISVLDADNKIAYMNPALEEILDISQEGLLRGDYQKRTYLRPDGTRMSADEFASSRAIREQRAVHNVETGMVKKDSQVVWMNVSAVPVTFSDWRVILVTVDITEHKRTDERIRREAARAGALARVASILNAQLDLDKVLDAVCSETARALNVPATSVTLYDPDRSVLSLASTFGLPPEISERFAPMPRSVYDEYALRGDPFILVPDVEAALGWPHGSRKLSVHRNFRTAAVASLMREGQLIGTLNIHVEGEQRVFDENELALLKGLTDEAAQAIANAQLFEQVMQQREQLRALAARLAEVEEAERRRLARELHDQVGQTLTALGINLNIVRAQMPGESSDAVRSRLEDSLALVEQTTERVRSVMAELRPPVLDDYGLVAALRWYGAQFSARTGLAVEVRGEELTPRLAAPAESALFRITQEALNNVVKHAQATQMTVTVESDGGIACLTVADDGIGFARSVAQRAAPNERGGWGLLNMAERAEAVGGQCRIESRPGQGTRVVVEVSR